MAKKTTYETAIALGARIKKTFSGATLSASKSLSKLAKQADKLTKAKQAASSFGALERQVRDADKRFKKARATMMDLGQEIQDTEKPTFELKQRFKEAKQATNRAEKALRKKRKELKRTRFELGKAGVSTKNAALAEKQLNRQLSKTQAKMRRMKSIRELGSRFRALGGSLRQVAKYAAMAGAALGAAVWKLTSSVARSGEKILNLSKATGISTKKLQEWRYAAMQAGMEGEEFDNDVMSGIVVALGELKTRSGPVYDALKTYRKLFKSTGLTLKRLKRMNPTDQFGAVLDMLSKIPNEAERVNVAAKLVGETLGPKFALMVAKGSAGLDKAAKEAHKAGAVMSKSALENMRAYQLQYMKLKAVLGGVAAQVGSALIPLMTRGFKGISRWLMDNQENIKRWGEAFAKWFGNKAVPVLKGLGKALWKIAKVVGAVIDKVAGMVGGYENLGKIIAVLALSKVAFDIAQIGRSAFSAASAIGGPMVGALKTLASAAASHPIIAMVTLLAGTLAIVIARWKKISEMIFGQKSPGLDSGMNATVKALNESTVQVPETLAHHFDKNAHKSTEAVKRMVSGIDAYLPHSDAKKGPLSRLSQSGRAFAETFANGVRDGSRGILGEGLLGAVSGVSGGSPRGGVGSVVLNFSPKIEVSGGAPGGDQITGALEISAEDLVRRLESVMRDRGRLAYE